jgi:hypothetical protein
LWTETTFIKFEVYTLADQGGDPRCLGAIETTLARLIHDTDEEERRLRTRSSGARAPSPRDINTSSAPCSAASSLGAVAASARSPRQQGQEADKSSGQQQSGGGGGGAAGVQYHLRVISSSTGIRILT